MARAGPRAEVLFQRPACRPHICSVPPWCSCNTTAPSGEEGCKSDPKIRLCPRSAPNAEVAPPRWVLECTQRTFFFGVSKLTTTELFHGRMVPPSHNCFRVPEAGGGGPSWIFWCGTTRTGVWFVLNVNYALNRMVLSNLANLII